MRALLLIGVMFVVGCGGGDAVVLEEDPPVLAGGCCIPTTGGCADGAITADACDGRFWIGRVCNAAGTACE